MGNSEKQIIWLNEFLTCFNATEAARRAGYKWPNKIGERLKKRMESEIKSALDAKAMDADEALARMSDIARGSAEDYLRIDKHGYVSLDLERMRSEGKLHLIKKYKVTKQGIEIELYDALTALIQIGKGHNLFTGVTEVEHSGTVEVNVADHRDRILASVAEKSSSYVTDPASGNGQKPIA